MPKCLVGVPNACYRTHRGCRWALREEGGPLSNGLYWEGHSTVSDMKREQSTFGLVCNISSGHALFSTSRIGVVTNDFWYLRITKNWQDLTNSSIWKGTLSVQNQRNCNNTQGSQLKLPSTFNVNALKTNWKYLEYNTSLVTALQGVHKWTYLMEQ